MKKLTPNQTKFLIGFLSGSCAAIPLIVLRVDASFMDAISKWSASYGGSIQREPLPVPQDSPPVGRGSSNGFPAAKLFAPCAAPPPAESAVPTYVSVAPSRSYRDMKAKILMNTAPGNRMRSLLSRVGYPDRFDSELDYWQTEDGEISMKRDDNDRVVSIQFVE
jgi:hypothetical protein